MNTTGRSNVMRGVVACVSVLCLCLAAAGETNSPALQYAKIYERELTGDVTGALAAYRALMEAAALRDPLLEQKVLYRVGVCEQALGNPEGTRKAWRRLVDSYPAGDAYVLHARAALKFLERELDRVVIEGVVVTEGRELMEPSVVLAGEWGHEPVIVTTTGGLFRVERKVAGRAADGRRYCLIYAEHAQLPLVAMDVLFEKQSPGLSNRLILSPTTGISGRVVDRQGRPVRGARVHVTGYQSDVALPVDSLLPSVFSGANGEFVIPGLPRGLRYVMTAEKSGYRLDSAAEKTLAVTLEPGSAGGETCGSVVLQSLGEVSLRGRIVDESGRPLKAVVAVWTSPPVSRELARTATDGEGRFMVRELTENWVVVKVESEGRIPRSIPGIKPMGQELDVVLKPGGNRMKTQPGAEAFPPQDRQNPEDAVGEGRGSSQPPELPTSLQIRDLFKTLRWIRGNPETGEPLRWDDMKGRVVTLHFGSAYLEASLRAQYPNELGSLSQMMKLYGDQGLVCIWVLPEGEDKGDSVRVALELYPELPIAVLMPPSGGDETVRDALKSLEQGNLVIRRNGVVQAVCPDLPLFKAVKEAILIP